MAQDNYTRYPAMGMKARGAYGVFGINTFYRNATAAMLNFFEVMAKRA